MRVGLEVPGVADQDEALAISEARLAVCSERLALVRKLGSLGYWEWHLDSGRLHWSDENLAIHAVTEEEFGGNFEEFLERVHPDDRESLRLEIESALAGGRAYEADYRVVRPGGDIRLLNQQGRVVADRSGRPVRVIGTTMDMTDCSLAEFAIVDGETRFRQLWESAYNAMLIVDASGGIVMANRSARRLFTYSADEFSELRIEQLIPARYRDRHVDYRAGFQACPHARRMGERATLKAVRRDGQEFDVDVSLSPLGIGPGSDILVEIQDLTRRRAMELQLRESQRIESLGKLAGGVAHELNNLLTAIMGFSEVTLRELGDQHPSHDDLHEIFRASGLAKSLIAQMLAFTRQQVLQPVVLDLNDTVDMTARVLRHLVRKDIEIATEFSSGAGSVFVDPSQLEQVLVNLAMNASEAMREGGRMTITTGRCEFTERTVPEGSDFLPGAFATFCVSDTGCGMSEDVLSHAFEPFYTTKGLGRCTGLGLSTVHGIVKQSNGHIVAQSQPGAGAAFTVYLPSVESEPAPAVRALEQTESTSGEGVILLIEDDITIRKMVTRVLGRHGYSVHVAECGEEALRKFADLRDVDLVISDVVLPDARGFTLLQPILEERPRLRVLFISGYDGGELANLSSLGERADFLAKPFTVASLLGKVAALRR